MRTKPIRLIIAVFMVVTLLAVCTIVSAGEVDYCGELQLTIAGEWPVSFHLVNTGASFFIVHGIMIPDPIPCDPNNCDPNNCDPDYKPIIFSGTGQVVELDVEGPVLFMNLHQTQEHEPKCNPDCSWRDARIVHLSLNLSPDTNGDITGKVWNIGIDFNPCQTIPYSANYDEYDIMLVGKLPKCIKIK